MQYIAASLYGISGTSSSTQAYDDNERLLSAAFIRVGQMQDVPYLLAADANVNPTESVMIRQALETEIAYDVFSDIFDGSPPPTYRKGNIIPEMDGEGLSRIVAIFCNLPAAHASQGLHYGIKEAASFDHVLLKLQIKASMFADEINTAVQPAMLNGRPYKQLSPAQKLQQNDQDEANFQEVWDTVAVQFSDAIQNQQLDDAHDL